jgi:DNA mismatch repair protein MutS2
VIVNKYKNRKKIVNSNAEITEYNQGDNVMISPTNEFGIVYSGPDQQGNYIVQVKGDKIAINHKRIKLYIAAEELYPADYDFDIIFESKENRKKSKIISKRHDGEIIIERSDK